MAIEAVMLVEEAQLVVQWEVVLLKAAISQRIRPEVFISGVRNFEKVPVCRRK